MGVICGIVLATRRVREGGNINQIWKQRRNSGLRVDQRVISGPQYQILECENRKTLGLSCMRLKCQSAGHPEGFDSKYYLQTPNVNVVNVLVVCISDLYHELQCFRKLLSNLYKFDIVPSMIPKAWGFISAPSR